MTSFRGDIGYAHDLDEVTRNQQPWTCHGSYSAPSWYDEATRQTDYSKTISSGATRFTNVTLKSCTNPLYEKTETDASAGGLLDNFWAWIFPEERDDYTSYKQVEEETVLVDARSIRNGDHADTRIIAPPALQRATDEKYYHHLDDSGGPHPKEIQGKCRGFRKSAILEHLSNRNKYNSRNPLKQTSERFTANSGSRAFPKGSANGNSSSVVSLIAQPDDRGRTSTAKGKWHNTMSINFRFLDDSVSTLALASNSSESRDEHHDLHGYAILEHDSPQGNILESFLLPPLAYQKKKAHLVHLVTHTLGTYKTKTKSRRNKISDKDNERDPLRDDCKCHCDCCL